MAIHPIPELADDDLIDDDVNENTENREKHHLNYAGWPREGGTRDDANVS